MKTAMAKENRFKQLTHARAISKQDYDDAVANQGSFEADVVSGHAAEKTARINLSYTKVTAPFAGRIGISQVTEGAYVQDSAANLLVNIQQIDKLYVDVTQASSEFLRLKEALANGKLKADAAGKAQVQLILEDGRVYPDEGTLEVSDVTVNAATNTVTVRAIFPNLRGDLLPGLFVRARLDEGSSPAAILVPKNSVTRNTKGEPTAMILGANDMAEVRVLKISRSVGNQWLVTEGLKPSEKLIVANLQKVRPGAPAKLSPFVPPPPTPATGSNSVTSKEFHHVPILHRPACVCVGHRDPPPRADGRLACLSAGCRASRTRQRKLHHALALQRQARCGDGDQTRCRHQCDRHGERGEKEGRRVEALFPA